jgi:hypothetical protein
MAPIELNDADRIGSECESWKRARLVDPSIIAVAIPAYVASIVVESSGWISISTFSLRPRNAYTMSLLSPALERHASSKRMLRVTSDGDS